MTALIALTRLSKVFYTEELETHALQDVDLTIASGEYLAIAGPSGCGKSTLLSILGLLDSPSTGSYTLAGESVASLTPAERAHQEQTNRVHLPVVQSHRRSLGVRER